MKRFLSVLAILAMMLALFAGCSGGDSGANYDYEYDAAPRDSGYGEAVDSNYEPSFDASEDYSAVPTFLDPDNERGVRLVYTVEMTLQTTAFPEGTRRLLGAVEEVGGFVRATYVEGRSLYEPDAPRYARYTLSIPTASLAGFLADMEDEFNLVRLVQDSRDLTARHTGSNAQLDSLRAQEQEYLELIAELDPELDMDFILELEYLLEEVRREISALSGSVAGMDADIYYSAVTIQLYEIVDLDDVLADREPPTFGERMRSTASGSVGSFVGFWQGLALFLTAAWPIIVVLVILAAAVIALYCLLRRAGVIRRTPKQPQSGGVVGGPQNGGMVGGPQNGSMTGGQQNGGMVGGPQNLQIPPEDHPRDR